MRRFISGVVACGLVSASPAGVASAAPKPRPAVVTTVLERDFNAEFQVNPTFFPEVAQTMTLSQPIAVQDVEVGVNSMSYATSPAGLAGSQTDVAYTQRHPGLPATVRAAIWRFDNGVVPEEAFDTRTGMTPIVSQTYSGPIPIGGTLTVRMPAVTTLAPGAYAVILSFADMDPSLVTLRLKGRQSGNERRGGVLQNEVKNCDYTPAADMYLGGRAFVGVGTPEVVGGPLGWQPTFRVHQAKVADCVKLGEYVDIWNQGDIQVSLKSPPAVVAKNPKKIKKPKATKAVARSAEFKPRPQPKPKPKPGKANAKPAKGKQTGRVPSSTATAPWRSSLSVTSKLPASSFAGLACDPGDPRLAGIALPNGSGPEARAAAACARLAWIEGASATLAPITVIAEPGADSEFVNTIGVALRAGDRILGRFGSPNRSYEWLWGSDPVFACARGTDLVDGRLQPGSPLRQPWASTINSGCPGSEYSLGLGSARALGPTGDIYFAYSLITPSDLKRIDRKQVGTPLWFGRFASHEMVHAMQLQRGAGNPYGFDSLPSWFGEGVAQYLGFAAGEYSVGPADMRQYSLNALRNDVQRAGIAQVDLRTADRVPGLPYSAGYFAAEYLFAHYGIGATFDWYAKWNDPNCPRSMTMSCPEALAPSLFGMSLDALYERLNAYVNAQVSD